MSYHDRPRAGDGGPADDGYDDSPSTAELRGEVRDTIETPEPTCSYCDEPGPHGGSDLPPVHYPLGGGEWEYLHPDCSHEMRSTKTPQVDSPLGLPIEGTQPEQGALDAAFSACEQDEESAFEICNSIGSTDEEKYAASAKAGESRLRFEEVQKHVALEAAWAEVDATYANDCRAEDSAENREAMSRKKFSRKQAYAESIGPRTTKEPS